MKSKVIEFLLTAAVMIALSSADWLAELIF